jgi:hypothetical protein
MTSYQHHIGPGSNNHWSDQFRSDYGNLMLMNTSTFNSIYGDGAWDMANQALNDPNVRSQWQQGKQSLAQGMWVSVPNTNIVGSSYWIDFNSSQNQLPSYENILRFVKLENAAGGGGATGAPVIFNAYSQPGDQFWMEFNMAAGAFVRNYRDMRAVNTIGADKYFHCKANFEATSYGPGGKFFAEHFSNLREIWDQNVKGYPRWDSFSDQEANQWGRDQVGEALNSCKACEKYRPVGLPDNY